MSAPQPAPARYVFPDVILLHVQGSGEAGDIATACDAAGSVVARGVLHEIASWLQSGGFELRPGSGRLWQRR